MARFSESAAMRGIGLDFTAPGPPTPAAVLARQARLVLRRLCSRMGTVSAVHRSAEPLLRPLIVQSAQRTGQLSRFAGVVVGCDHDQGLPLRRAYPRSGSASAISARIYRAFRRRQGRCESVSAANSSRMPSSGDLVIACRHRRANASRVQPDTAMLVKRAPHAQAAKRPSRIADTLPV
jgi:hypothetical protein